MLDKILYFFLRMLVVWAVGKLMRVMKWLFKLIVALVKKLFKK